MRAARGPARSRSRWLTLGLCGTDLHILHGDMDSRVTIPAITRHEMSGTIAQVGDGVEGWAAGDPVTVMPLAWCGTCPACLAGNSHVCQRLNFVGIDSSGSLQSRWRKCPPRCSSACRKAWRCVPRPSPSRPRWPSTTSAARRSSWESGRWSSAAARSAC